MTQAVPRLISVCWLGLALGCSNAGTAVPAPATFKLESIRSFDCAQAPTQFEFDADGNLWLRSEKVLKYTPAGEQLAEAEVPISTDMAIDRRGNLWVSNQYNLLVKFGPDGREIWRKDYHFEDWTAPPLLVTHDDAVWIHGDRLEKLDLDGHTQLAFDAPLFSNVFFRDIKEAPSGELWLVGDGLGKVSSAGVPIASYLPGSALQASAIDQKGNLWFINLVMKNNVQKGAGHQEVIKVSADGRQLLTLPVDDTPWAVAVDRQDNVWVSSYASGSTTARLEKFSPDGVPLGQASLEAMSGMAIDRAGFLWVGQNVSSHGTVTQFSIQ